MRYYDYKEYEAAAKQPIEVSDRVWVPSRNNYGWVISFIDVRTCNVKMVTGDTITAKVVGLIRLPEDVNETDRS